jgi:hypothetical protein
VAGCADVPDVQEEGSRRRNLRAAYGRDEYHRADCAQELRQETQENDGSEMKSVFDCVADEPVNLFWTDDGWCVDLREHRNYPVYGEGDWTLRTDNAGIGCRG